VRQDIARVVASLRVGADMALVVLEVPGIASEARPGQFVMVRCGDLPLRRPLSVHAADGGRIALLFRVTGQGTTWLAARKSGSECDITGPLGNGYTSPVRRSRVLLLAGGLGIAPLSFLASRLATAHEVLLVQGARTSAELYLPDSGLCGLLSGGGVPTAVRRLLATDDGSMGTSGSALQAASPHLEWAERVYVCGPVAMCAAACRCAEQAAVSLSEGVAITPTAARRLLDAEVSLEARMGCGVGACYACSIPVVSGRVKVCRDGPVFRFGDVIWQSLAT